MPLVYPPADRGYHQTYNQTYNQAYTAPDSRYCGGWVNRMSTTITTVSSLLMPWLLSPYG